MEKSKLIDASGKPLTQSLFLETGYSSFAIYTLKDDDFLYKGKLLPSIKKIYLEMEDTTEYEFANACFLGWSHWNRITQNKLFEGYVALWREELELKLRARGLRSIIKAADEGVFSASRWLADRGWDKRAPGRPNKGEKAREQAIQKGIAKEFDEGIVSLKKWKNNG